MERKILRNNPLKCQLAAVSCGIYQDQAIVDLDYIEDSGAAVDANFVLNSNGNLVELQATGEENDFSQEQFMEMLTLAKEASTKLFQIQNKILLED